jgi:prophage regulatory protein
MTDNSRNFTETPLGKYKAVMDGGDRLLRLAEVRSKTGLGTTSIYKYMKEQRFPNRIHIGVRMVGWLESEVNAWILDQTQAG